MSIDNSRQVDFARTDLFLQNRSYSTEMLEMSLINQRQTLYSGGLAGSIITASFDFSSTTR